MKYRYEFETGEELQLCKNCPVCEYNDFFGKSFLYCGIRRDFIFDEESKPDWCPLIKVGEGE